MHEPNQGFVRYENVEADYLKRRQLRKGANWLLLWALGVGAVISGDFFGWQYGLGVGGFWGLALATFLMAVLYITMVFSIAELSAALPHAGGFYSFVRNALGPTLGFICGMTDAIEYVLTPAVIVVGIGGYLDTLFFSSAAEAPGWMSAVWWILAYALFVGINLRSVELTLKVGLVITALAAGVLILFFVASIVSGAFDANRLFNIAPMKGHSAKGLPFGAFGVLAAVPFATWFYLAIEQLPLAAEETHDVVNSMPKALIWGILTLLALSLGTLVINSGVDGGAVVIAQSEAPVADGFRAVLGTGATTAVLVSIALTGLIASFHAIIYAYGRVLFALSRAGYLPRWISVVNGHHAPQRALLLGAAIGLGCATAIRISGNRAVGAALLNMAVFAAVISYMLVMISYIHLKRKRPELSRPYVSPLGIPGAAIGAVLSVLTMGACFITPDYRAGVAGTAVFLAAAILYFFLYARRRLVAQAPEEEIALIAQAQRDLAHD